MAACRFEVHHRLPCCLLGYFDRAREGDLDGQGLQRWFDWEEAFRYRVDPAISRKEHSSLIASSAARIPATEHRTVHQEASDFVRWGRRGGLRTLALYGQLYFSLLADLRWGRIEGEALIEHRAGSLKERGISNQPSCVLSWCPRTQ
jgi:hypothetical protein